MKNNYSILILVVQCFCFSLNTNLSVGGDTISVNESVSSGQTIISSGENFELGFFRPADSRYYYIGIWYKRLNLQTVVWVANRDKPLDGADANLIINQGNLVLLDGLGNSIWSALAGNINPNISVTALLRDDGNLILSDVSKASMPSLLWQSFDYPTHTFLPGAKLGYDKRTQRKQILISWKSLTDPAPGLYSMEIDPKHAQYVIKWNKTTEYWASGSWDGQQFGSVPEMSVWNLFWTQPRKSCEVYAKCGAFGVCDEANATCNCLSGFKPRLDRQWNSKDYSGGCVRDQKVQCNAITEDTDSSWITSNMRVPASQDTNITVGKASQCRSACFYTCSCTAYTYDGSGNCSILTGDLYNLQQLSTNEIERTIFVKRGSPEGHSQSDRSKGTQEAHISHWHKAEGEAKVLMNENSDEAIDVPYFHLETILEATDNFSNENKLGQGGFGPVYKGNFPGEKEIAVKTLSSQSGQGIDEFKNEVTLIAKLQHRNLVRLLGYCINATEQILLYEYMPNKSLDTFIFDGTLCQLLDWKKRYDIILGIARGLSYLHHDSRLRIIHRDLKTSNILLDEEMNPKISDFGLARIVEGKVTEANTKKVVGTYGYMSPEYALDGLFSIKSDVFSFGVVVLEIISGRRNTGFYQSEEALNLLGYAWKLWTEKAETQLIEKSLLESCNRSEAIKCINVALLCVQEDPNHRPNMSDVIVMLGGEGTNLPTPNRPAFVKRTHASSTSSSSSDKKYIVSNNQVTITVEEGR
ncbi:hypothetical protein RDI58_017423 [Solanum bulbocastanum]|uniref:Receptor-like serine/threonine-protein kinase n=1 Tax=Solanum bulbocastanum TaxID=147425 RepID=A0AAN8Y8W2_SOLBU